MAVDKNLFLYDLAVVAIMKNEGPYVKEWLDYHILAGVDHFFIYDHESDDNSKEILQPYIERGIVTYLFCPDEKKQVNVYNEALQNYKFFCRYITFIDGDEFILPKSKPTIFEVADEILADKPNIGGIEIKWDMYGSNNLEKADYSKGVLERFPLRAAEPAISVKSVVNPRTVDYMHTPHFMHYFFPVERLNSETLKNFFPNDDYDIQDKITINHYHLKSFEEYKNKMARNSAAYGKNPSGRSIKNFSHDKYNDVFDDGILNYRKARIDAILGKRGGGIGKQLLEILPAENERFARVYNAIIKILFGSSKNLTPDFLKDKIEEFLICLTLSRKFNIKVADKEFDNLALMLIVAAMNHTKNINDVFLLIAELPNIFSLPYPDAVNKFRENFIVVLEKWRDALQSVINIPALLPQWKNVIKFEYTIRLLKSLK